MEIEDDDKKSIKEFVDYFRSQEEINENEIEWIEKDYHKHSPVWWHTAEMFLYSTLNRALRLMESDIIIRMAFFIRHLHNRRYRSRIMSVYHLEV